MSKILVTGMTASHTSAESNRRAMSYAGAIVKTLGSSAHEVVWSAPEISWTRNYLDTFDVVLVGISPLTSLAANRVYGALHVIETLRGSSKLVFFVDAPEPHLITASLSHTINSPETLVKPFFSYRKEYDEASKPDTSARLLEAVKHLLTEEWPTTLYPEVPWTGRRVEAALPKGVESTLIGLNLDSHLIQSRENTEDQENFWAYDGKKNPWIASLAQNLRLSVVPMKANKVSSDEEVGWVLDAAVGSILGPQRDGSVWWTYRIVQSLESGIPVLTEWRDSSALGDSWNHLGSAIESMSAVDRLQTSEAQRIAYLSAIPDKISATASLELALGLEHNEH